MMNRNPCFEFMIFGGDGVLVFYHNFNRPEIGIMDVQATARIQHLSTFGPFLSERLAEFSPDCNDELTCYQTSQYKLWYYQLIDCCLLLLTDPSLQSPTSQKLKNFHTQIFMPQIRKNFLVPPSGQITSQSFRNAVIEYFKLKNS